MRQLKSSSSITTALVCIASLAAFSPARAEDTKGKWQFGFGLSYMSTVDYIRSNADLAIASGAVGECGEGALCPVESVDERPDINILNQPSIRDDFKLDFSASYGLTRWLAIEAAVSYLEAPVGNIEYYNRDVHQGLAGNGSSSLVSLCGPALGSVCWDYQPNLPDEIKNNTFLPVGQLREIPIHLSGLIRFRPESPLDPYIGAGAGYIMTKLTTSSQFNEVAETISTLWVSTASEGEFTVNNRCNREGLPIGQGCNNFAPEPLQAKIKNAFEWHAVGGVDYYATDHFSVYVDARYVWTSGALDIRTDRAHQVRFAIEDNGRLLTQIKGRGPITEASPYGSYDPNVESTWFLWEDMGVAANRNFQDNICPKNPDGSSMCRNSGFLETEDKNMNGSLNTRCDGPDGEFNYCEDEGFLYRLLPGSRDIDEAMVIECPNCRHNYGPGPDGFPGTLDDLGFDTEDANGNGYLDRFLLYGVDICTTPQAAGNQRCLDDRVQNTNYNYVWPEGCSQDPATLGSFSQLTESGCPPFPAADPATGQRPHVQTTVNDNAPDTYIIQGGKIRMGGFSLGVGFKFTF